jgi:NTE family protein
MKQIGLVLQGGGALGAYELGVLERLYQEPNFKPDIVSWVSIGAITAAVICGCRHGDPIGSLKELWNGFTVASAELVPDAMQRFVALFGNPKFYNMRWDYYRMANWTSFYNTEPLRNTLNGLVAFEKINGNPRLIITATNVETGRLETFDSSEMDITVDHVIASGSLPPGFPMTVIEGRCYWDGGLFDNTPLGQVVDAFRAGDEVERTLIVVNLFPAVGKIPEDMLQVFDRTFEIAFSNKIGWDVNKVRQINEYVETIKAIDNTLPKESPVRRSEGYRLLKKYKKIGNVIYVTNSMPEAVFAPFDFSQHSIEARCESGYEDADKALRRQDYKF